MIVEHLKFSNSKLSRQPAQSKEANFHRDHTTLQLGRRIRVQSVNLRLIGRRSASIADESSDKDDQYNQDDESKQHRHIKPLMRA